MSEFIDYVFQRSTSLNKIDNSLYSKYNVKNGLRNEDGTGVLVEMCIRDRVYPIHKTRKP